jgi:magnesium chelatase family protein
LRYLNKLSGPFLDRIDIQLEVTRLPKGLWTESKGQGETSLEVRNRVSQCRAIQMRRQGKANAHLSSTELMTF